MSALMVVMLISLLGIVAVAEAESGSNSAAVVRKHMQLLASANAGASAAVASIENQASSITYQNQDMTCASANQDLVTTAANGAANAASGETYTLYYDVFTTQPTTTELNDIQSNPSGWSSSSFSNYSAGGLCSSSSNTQIAPPSAGGTWFLVLASSGSTASSAYGAGSGTGKTSVIDLQMDWATASTTTTSSTSTTSTPSTTTTTVPSTTTTTGVTTGQLTGFTDAMFGKAINPGQSFCNTSPPSSGCPGTGGTYLNSQLNCNNSNNYMGNVFANDTTDSYAVTGGNCYIEGNLYTTGSINMGTGGGGYPCPASGSGTAWDVCDNVYATGSSGVTVAGGWKVKGSIYSTGPVSLSGGADISGSIYSQSTVTTTGGTTVGGKIYQNCTPTSCPGAVPITLPPTQTFPQLTFSSTAWQNAGFTVLNYGSSQTCDPTNGAMPSADYSQMETDVQIEPTVVVTNCAVVWDASENPDQGTDMSLKHSLAVFASGGFNFDNNVTTEIAGSGTPAPDFWAIVPWGGSPSTPVNGEAACPSAKTIESKSNNPKGDVWDSTDITGTNVLLYTPDNVCTASVMTMTGQIYAGNDLTANGTFTPNPGVALPYGVTSGGGGTTTTTSAATTTTTVSPTTTSSTTTTTLPTTTTIPTGTWNVTIVGIQ